MAKVRKRLTPYQVDLDPIEITGFEITTLRLANQLEPGKFYRVTDFQTVHRLLNPTTIIRGNLEHILVLATSGSSLSKRCGSFNFPQDELEIDWTSTVAEDGTTPRAGWIVYRRDTVRNVECYFDYRNVKVRRWQFNGFDHEMGFVETSASNITLTLTWSANMSSTYLSRYRKWEIRFPAGFTHAAGPINLTITKGAFSHTRPLVRKTTMLSDWTANELASKVGPIVYSPALDAYILMDIYDVGAGQNGFFIARTNTAYTVGNGLRVLPGATYNDYLTFNGLDPTETYLGPNCSNNFFINAVSYFKLGGGSTGNSFVGRVLNSEIGAETVNNLFLNMFDWSFCMGEMTNCVLDHNTYTHLSKNPTDSNLICGPGSFNLTFEEGLVVRSLTVYAWGWGTRFSGYYNTDSFVALTGAGPNGSDVTFTKKIISSIIGYFNGDGLTFDRQFVSKYLHVKPTRVNNLESLNINALKTAPGTTELLTIDEFGNVSKRVDIPAEDPTFTPVFLFRDAPNTNDWNGCAYGNGIFVAVASSGVGNRAMSSPDGDVWTARTTPADHAWISACYGTPGFVAVATTPTTNAIMHSIDGINWTLRTVGVAAGYTFVAFVNNLYVAVGDGVHITTSVDGVTWTERTGASDSAYLLKGVAYGAGLYVIVGALGPADSAVMTSPDGVTWTKRTTPVIPASAGFDTVAYGNGMFIAYGHDGSTGFAMTSVDGITWTVLNTISEPGGGSMIFAYGLFFIIGFLEGSSLQYTPDGLVWYPVPVYSEYRPWGQLTEGNGSLLSVTYSGEHKVIKSLPISLSKPIISAVTPDSTADVFTQLYANGIGIVNFQTKSANTGYPTASGQVLQFSPRMENSSSDRIIQIYAPTTADDLYFRRISANASSGWNKLWHSGNLAGNVVTLDTAQTITGYKTFSLPVNPLVVNDLDANVFVNLYANGIGLSHFSVGAAHSNYPTSAGFVFQFGTQLSNTASDRFTQLYSANGSEWYLRRVNSSIDHGWKRIWHSGNLTPTTGTGIANQITYWSGTNTQTGNAGLTVDATNKTIRIDSATAGYSDLSRTMGGLELVSVGMSATNKYFPAIKWMSRDPELTTENPKFVAAINGIVEETYSTDLSGGAGIGFFTTPIAPGATSLPQLRWVIKGSGILESPTAQTIQTSAGLLTLQPLGVLDSGVNITANVNIYSSGGTGVIRNTIPTGRLTLSGGATSGDGASFVLTGPTNSVPSQIKFRIGALDQATLDATAFDLLFVQLQAKAGITNIALPAPPLVIGPILTFTITNGGSGYVDGTYVDVALTLVGTASYGQFDITVVGGVVTGAVLKHGGNNYRVGAEYTIANTLLGGTGSGLIITVNTVIGAELFLSKTVTGATIRLENSTSNINVGSVISQILFSHRDATAKASGDRIAIIGKVINANGGGYLEFETSNTSVSNRVLSLTVNHEGIKTLAGTALLPSIGFINDPDTGIYSAGANVIGFSAGGVPIAQFEATGLTFIGSQEIKTDTGTLKLSTGVGTGDILLSTNDPWAVRITGNRLQVGIQAQGVSNSSIYNVWIPVQITGGVNGGGLFVQPQIKSDVTGSAYVFRSGPYTEAAAFTLGSLTHFNADTSTFGAGSVVTNQYGFYARGTLTAATNNFAFRSDVAAGTGRWNLYMAGTANNYLAGNLMIGNAVATDATAKVEVTGRVSQIVGGSRSTIFGTNSGSVATGANTTIFGYDSGVLLTTGANNTLIGKEVGKDMTTGNACTFVGTNAGTAHVSGTRNVAIGATAFRHNLVGNDVVVVGAEGARYYSGGLVNADVYTSGVYIGAISKVGEPGATNEIVIGQGAEGLGSNNTVIGKPATVATTLYGTVRPMVINNLGATPAEVLVPSETGVISKRTLAEFKADLGLSTFLADIDGFNPVETQFLAHNESGVFSWITIA